MRKQHSRDQIGKEYTSQSDHDASHIEQKGILGKAHQDKAHAGNDEGDGIQGSEAVFCQKPGCQKDTDGDGQALDCQLKGKLALSYAEGCGDRNNEDAASTEEDSSADQKINENSDNNGKAVMNLTSPFHALGSGSFHGTSMKFPEDMAPSTGMTAPVM